uniref:RSV epitope scaffold FFL_005 n=1 Tax=synthetic construct TaxID=32630 RepID=UPI0003ED1A77|nr:Chain A, RSV epitope scaffold FFL_005 [synthetic construct]4L8I_B Chain B, RSV epitope scaffold FFL_005 [synthetic construct]
GSMSDIRKDLEERFDKLVEALKNKVDKMKAAFRMDQFHEERMKDWFKDLRKEVEQMRRAVRNYASEALSKINDLPITNDDKKLASNDVLKLVAEVWKKLEAILADVEAWFTHHHH